MIKIRVGKTEEIFEDNQSAMQYVADMAGDKRLKFQRIEYNRGELVQMEYLTFYQGRLKETYLTRR